MRRIDLWAWRRAAAVHDATSSWDGMRGKGSRRAEACLLIGRIFVTSFNRNRESPPLSLSRSPTSTLWVNGGNVSQCSAIHDREKEILSWRDLGNFISRRYGPCNGELVRLEQERILRA